MNRSVILFLFIVISFCPTLYCFPPSCKKPVILYLSEQDTLAKNQDLYNGKIWTNKHRRIEGDPFLFANYFLSGTVSENGKTYKNLQLRYDIFSDEIMIPVNREEIILLNNELVDSFTISFDERNYNFIKIGSDTLNGLEGFNGYLQVLYKQKSALYIKSIKEITPHISDKSDGDFLASERIYFVRDGHVRRLSSVNDLYKALNSDPEKFKIFVKINKLKVSKNKPESYIPVIKYFDSIGK